MNEPTVPGPNGTEIGAKSGAIRPAGSSSQAGTASSDVGGGGSGGASVSASGAGSSSSTSGGMATRAIANANTTTPAYPQSAIDQLVSLGFSRDEAVSALNATDGNVDYAAGLLFQN